MYRPSSMKVWFFALALLLIGPGVAHSQTAKEAMRIGIYDSRAVALAYYNSAPQRRYLQELQAEYQKAKATNDENRVKELEESGPARQEMMHLQVFGGVTIPNVIAAVRDKLPVIAKDARVVLLVSKWEVTYRDPAIEYVDVTMPLVKLFDPEDKVLKWIEEMKTQEPIPVDKLPREVKK